MDKIAFPFDSEENMIKTLTSWSCLQEYGYFLVHKKNRMLISGRKCIGFCFKNTNINREIEISIVSGINSVFVRNNDKSLSKFTNKSFTIDDWLRFFKKRLPDDFDSKIYYEICRDSGNVGIQPFFEFIEKLFHGPLKPVIKGERWDKVPRDVIFTDYDCDDIFLDNKW